MWLEEGVETRDSPTHSVPQTNTKSPGLSVQWREQRSFPPQLGVMSWVLCPFPSPTRALGHVVLLVLLGSTQYPSSAHEGKEPTQLVSLHTLTGLFPCTLPLLSPALSHHPAIQQTKRSHLGIFPKTRDRANLGPRTDQNRHPRAAPPSVSGRGALKVRDQREAVGEKAALSWAGAGVTEKASCIPSLSSAFLSIHPAPPPRVPIKGAASSQTTPLSDRA